MRKPKELPEGALESLAMGLKQAKTKAEFQSVQCLWENDKELVASTTGFDWIINSQ